MKNILKPGLYFIGFLIGGILFQISCSNSDETSTSITEKFVYVKKDFPSNGEQSIWIANLDGTEATQIPITLPANLLFYSIYSSGEHTTAKLSADGQTVLFTVQKSGTNETYIYSCGVDGNNLQEVASFDSSVGVFL